MAGSYEHVCLSAGGLKFHLHLGALQYLEDAGITPAAYAGSSCGAAVAALMVAGYRPRQVHDICKRHPLSMFKLSRPVRWGVCKPAGRDEVRGLLRMRSGGHNNRDPTFQQLADETGKRLYLTATRVRDGELVIFGADESTMDVPVHRAVTASCSIPFMNPATEIDGDLYVDGALSSYLPMRAFESVDDKRTVIGLMIADSAKRLTKAETFEEYSGSLADMILRKLCSEESTWSGDRTVAFGKNKLADIGLFASPNEVQADSMFEDGLSCMQDFMKNEITGAN